MSFDRRRLLIANAAKKGGVTLGSLAVGDGLLLNMQGAAKDFVVVHKGAPSYSGGLFAKYEGFDGGVIVMTPFASQFWSGSSPTWDSWSDSMWQEDIMPVFEQAFDAQTREAIMPVTIPYKSTSAFTSSSSNQRVWVPSASECGRDMQDGGTFDYFADSAVRSERLKAVFDTPGTYVQHVTRTGYEVSSSHLYYNITTAGVVSGGQTSASYCRICLVLPEDFVVKVPE